MKSDIYVVSHKNVTVPKGRIYQPIQVGLNKENFMPDLKLKCNI